MKPAFNRLCAALGLCAAIWGAGFGLAIAQGTEPPEAQLIKPQDVVEPQPLTCELLALEYADGGVALAEKVRLLVVAEPGLVDDILALIGCATPDQIAAIGAGLGQAAAILNETDPQAAEAIAVLVASLGNEAVQTAFVSGLGDATAAIGDEITGANPTALFVQSSGSSIGGGSAVSEN